MKFIYHDGGRKEAGYKGTCGDCVARAIAIATELPYIQVYKALAEINVKSRCQGRDAFKVNWKAKLVSRPRTVRKGVFTRGAGFKRYMASLGWKWTPTMGIGTGCKVHLRENELPSGRLIVKVSKHYCAVIDGVIYDNHDPQRLAVQCDDIDKEDVNGSRCVYGYWRKELASK